jgi:hypothetical protein
MTIQNDEENREKSACFHKDNFRTGIRKIVSLFNSMKKRVKI